MSEANWYVVHTYSGYENKVKADIEKTIENRKLQDQILEVQVPLEEVVEIKNGKESNVSKKVFPGYVLINMIMNDATWYVVRNTRGVTGFVGPGSKPVPLAEEEVRVLGLSVREAEKETKKETRTETKIEIDIEVGDNIKIVSGAWEGTIAEVKEINHHKQSVVIDVDMFGRPTSVEIGFLDILKL